MKARWISLCKKLSATPADFYAAARKILRNETVVFQAKHWRSDLTLEDIGYTKNKLNRLIKDYLVVEARDKSVELFKHFVKRGSYASTSFTTCGHLTKSGATSPSESVETRGPCIQSVVLTIIPQGRGKVGCSVDLFYRTTEFYKKFAADLLLVDILLEPFDFSQCPVISYNFHFVGVTMHPMYCLVAAALYEDPLDFFEEIRKNDSQYYKNCVSWSWKYLVSSQGITKYEQAKAVQRKVIESLKKSKNLKALTEYIEEAYEKTRTRR